MVKIIVDSTSDIPQEEAARLGITVVPLTVRFGTEEYRDGVDLMPAEFFKKFAAGYTKFLQHPTRPSAERHQLFFR